MTNLDVTLFMFHAEQNVKSHLIITRKTLIDEYHDDVSTHTHTNDNLSEQNRDWVQCNVCSINTTPCSSKVRCSHGQSNAKGLATCTSCVRSLWNYEDGLLWELHYSYKCFKMSWKDRTYMYSWTTIYSCVWSVLNSTACEHQQQQQQQQQQQRPKNMYLPNLHPWNPIQKTTWNPIKRPFENTKVPTSKMRVAGRYEL